MFENRSIVEVCSIAKRLGYQGIEIAPFTLNSNARDISSDLIATTRKSVEDAGLEVVGLHWLLAGPTGVHMTTCDDVVYARTKEYMWLLVDLCGDLGGSVMVIGSPKQRNIEDGQSVDGAWRRVAELFASVLDKAAERGVTLCIEPLSPIETNFINTVEEGMRMVRELNHPNFKIHLDVKAMFSEGCPIPEIIRSVKAEDIGHFHVNDPNLYGPGMGELDYAPLAEAIEQIGYDKWLSVEVFKYDPDPEIVAKKSIECLRRFWA